MKNLSITKSIISLLLLIFLALFICPAHAVSVHAEEIQDSTESVSYEERTANYEFDADGAADAAAADEESRNKEVKLSDIILPMFFVFLFLLSIILLILKSVKKTMQDKGYEIGRKK